MEMGSRPAFGPAHCHTNTSFGPIWRQTHTHKSLSCLRQNQKQTRKTKGSSMKILAEKERWLYDEVQLVFGLRNRRVVAVHGFVSLFYWSSTLIKAKDEKFGWPFWPSTCKTEREFQWEPRQVWPRFKSELERASGTGEEGRKGKKSEGEEEEKERRRRKETATNTR